MSMSDALHWWWVVTQFVLMAWLCRITWLVLETFNEENDK